MLMKSIVDTQTEQTVSAIEQAWRNPSTFLILPGRFESRRREFEEQLDLMPMSYQRHHFVLLTSGSTGNPRLVVGEKRRAERLALLLHDVQCNQLVRAAILCLPLSYSFGLINLWLWSRVNSAKLIFSKGFADPDKFREVLTHSQDVMLCLVRAQVKLFEQYFTNQYQFPSVVRVHFAGGRFPQESVDYLHGLFPNARIFNNYGCVEAMPRLTIREALASDWAMNVGTPIAGVELQTAKDGALLFKSPYAAVATIEHGRFREYEAGEPIATGDLGHQDEDGSWVIEGRTNEVFKRYGEKISVSEIETETRKTWHGEFAYYREADPAGEEGYIMVCCPNPERQDLRNILQVFRKSFTRVQWPLRIESVDTLPLLPSGKPDIDQLSSGDEDHRIVWRQLLR
jgi:acyl-CoA synthetase (AMP-forming)/AMP-acid ligase II